MYRYKHRDGSTGMGVTTWAAICAALGEGRADNMMDMADGTHDLDWQHVGKGRVSRRAELIGRHDGTVLGTFQELYQ